MTTTENRKDEKYYTGICIEKCGGKCCEPWWGVVSYTLRKDNGLSRLSAFSEEVLSSVKEREKRILDNYVTTDETPRPLFISPERYNLKVESIDIKNKSLLITFRAMFAFNCSFFSGDKSCELHPSITGVEDVRPPHCGYMGTLNAKYGEKGFCRIIHTAEVATDEESVTDAIALETKSSEVYFKEGYETLEPAVDAAINYIKDFCHVSAPEFFPNEVKTEKTGRNDPCPCGSGRKYKKCHGRPGATT